MAVNGHKRSAEDNARYAEQAKKYLTEILPYGTTVYTMVTKRNRQGFVNVVAVLAVVNGEIKNISSSVTDLIGRKWDDSDGVVASNAYDVVQKISYELYGYKGKGRQANAECSNPKKCGPKNFKAGYTFDHKAL